MFLLRSCMAHTTLVRGDAIPFTALAHPDAGRSSTTGTRSIGLDQEILAQKFSAAHNWHIGERIRNIVGKRPVVARRPEESDPGVLGHWLCKRSPLADDL
jgi:hypothetical protein